MKLLHRRAERAVLSRLEALQEGRLVVHHGGSTTMLGAAGDLAASITVRSPAFFGAVALGGHLGAAESYARGEWDTDDLTTVIRLLARNREAFARLEGGWARAAEPFRRILHALRRNTVTGSRRNVVAHYDLGNDFFALFLDDTMTYSAGIFADPDATLRDASLEKYDRLCRKLDLQSDDSVVEVGGGWGGFALHAAGRYGCRVTGTTISPAQLGVARARVAAAGLGDRVTILDHDYRRLTGRFDKLVSIEMIEAVGHHYHREYFRRCSGLLGSEGLAAIQAITIQDHLYAPAEPDFIKRHIFPGTSIPSLSVLTSAAAGTDLRLVHLEDFTPHYAETLRRWRARFEERWPEARRMGFDERFRRLWRFYFCYCEAGFEERILGSMQLLFAKPRAEVPSALALAAASRDPRAHRREEALA